MLFFRSDEYDGETIAIKSSFCAMLFRF